MQKDIQTSKGETSQQKFESQPFTDKPSVGETASHKMKEVGHDINASLKENVGVGVGNYPSNEDRKQSELHGKKFEEKKEDLKDVAYEKKEDLKEKTNETMENVKQTTMPIGHKVQEIAHDINATLKQNVGIGVGNYSSEVDQQKSQEHKEKYEEGIKDVKKKVEDIKQTAYEKKEDIKGTLSEKKDELYEKAHEGTTGLYTHRIEEVGHLVNAKLKETIGVGLGDYPSEVDRQRAEEHNKEYMEKVKESGKVEVSDSNPIVHKIKEVAHTVNANLKEMIGVGVGNYSSEVDRELSELHHKKYEEKQENTSSNNTNVDLSEKPFEETKEKLEEKLFGNKEGEPTQGSTTTTPKKEAEQAETKEQPKFSESDFPKL